MTTDALPHAGAATKAAEAPAPGRAASVAVASVAFVVVTGETLPVGLIGDVARGVGATESQVGLAVGWYAMVAALSAVPLTRLTSRLDRRAVLVACALVFGAGHVLAALATDVPVFLVGRSVAALAHGLYFAVATPAVVRIARPEARLRAGSRVAVGGSLALVLGTPLATLVGQAAGWRTAMLVVAVASTVLGLVVARVLPPMPALHQDGPRSAGGVTATLRSRSLAVILAVTVVLVTGHFALFTYVAPYAEQQVGVRGTTFSVVLLAFGLAAVAGSTFAGRLAERRPVRGVRLTAALMVAATVGLYASAQLGLRGTAVALLVVWGGTFSVLAVSTGLAIVRRAPAAQAETAFALHGIVFQAGILGGSALGALVYDTGRVPVLPLVTAAAAAVVLLVLTWAGRAFRAADAGPAEIAPAEIGPAEIVPAGATPAEAAPAS